MECPSCKEERRRLVDLSKPCGITIISDRHELQTGLSPGLHISARLFGRRRERWVFEQFLDP
jgi:hypothetical protein